MTLSGGARLDRWSVNEGELREWLLASGEPLRDERYPRRSGWRPTARAAAVVDAAKGLSLRAAAYLGWRLPTLNEFFRPFRVGADATAANPLLDPERLKGIEAGAELKRGPLTLSATLFANRLQNAIANVTLATGPGVFPGVGFVGAGGLYRQRRNLDSIRVRGAEASAAAEIGAVSLRLGASLTHARVESSGPAAALGGLRPAQTPRWMFSGEAGWNRDGQTLALTFHHSGAQFEDDLNSERLPPATTLGGFAAWPLTNRLDLVARGENLLNALVVAGIGGDGSVERATPRTIWIGLRLR